MRIIWQGSNRGQVSQTIIWLLVGLKDPEVLLMGGKSGWLAAEAT